MLSGHNLNILFSLMLKLKLCIITNTVATTNIKILTPKRACITIGLSDICELFIMFSKNVDSIITNPEIPWLNKNINPKYGTYSPINTPAKKNTNPKIYKLAPGPEVPVIGFIK